MARSRNIKPGFFTNDELGGLPPLTRLFFIGLWCHADREGRLEERIKRLKVEILPFDNCSVSTMLEQLSHGASPMLVRYSHGAQKYIQIVNFKKHQNPHIKEPASVIPPPPAPDKPGAEHQTSTIPASCKNRSCMVLARLIPDSLLLIPDSLKLIPDSGFPSTTLSGKPDGGGCQIPYQEILDSVNKVLQTSFRVTEKHKTLIKCRWREGFREGDFVKVCENMKRKWGSDPKMQQYLRPLTLFSEKMDSYLNQKGGNCGPLSKAEQINQTNFQAAREFVDERSRHEGVRLDHGNDGDDIQGGDNETIDRNLL